MNQFYTYLHCKPNGDPFYVGKGCVGRGHSKRSHDFKKDRNSHYKNVIEKYGKSNILVYVFPCCSESQAFADEIQHIAQFRKDGYELCNQTSGGDGVSGKIVSVETREKIANARRGKKTPPEVKAKMSAWHKGKVVTNQTRVRLSEALKSYWLNKRVPEMKGS